MAEPHSEQFPETADLIGPASSKSEAEATDGMPARLGRYRILARLGAGGFGVVYKAYDDDLRREVAIKAPHRHRLNSIQDADAYLDEGRVLASLNHTGIVPVHDVGRTDDGLCYIVSQFVNGSDLAERIRASRPTITESVEITAQVGEALHHAHKRGLVHRDVKPANILLDAEGRLLVTDFGLVLREENLGKGTGFAGTPAYMSPEQARSEGHRVDARSDVYSLGVVFYELLTGQRPFRATDLTVLLEQIVTLEPRPPRQLNDAVPRELDRICVKALSKRAADRYSTALDLAEDLRHWQRGSSMQTATSAPVSPAPPTAAPSAAPAESKPASDSRPALERVVPRGLRSFNAEDADFFLDLLPGPRNRDGLPDSIAFWKSRLEAVDAEQTFPVGLLYGPSGCGKSSLVKAGLLPRLAAHVLPIYLEASADETEVRLLKALRRRCPELSEDAGLVQALMLLRRRQVSKGQKVVLVLDQFEQWLHGAKHHRDAELVQALRQCDGAKLQCLLLVRDDFWMAITGFLHHLEVRLAEGRNSLAVDLFDPRHARKLLTAFGRAYAALPQADLTAQQERFLDLVIEDLAQEGKVIPVRLSLFAEMVKGKEWTPATLKAVGGTEGVGVAFLEEMFGAAAARLDHRLHQKAALAVLQALLPGYGTEIKGHSRSRQELIEASGYAQRPGDFEELMRLLDAEMRLVTPTGEEIEPGSPDHTGRKDPSYQLTHDYLVPVLRQWLTRKQRETRQGRAGLRLAEWASGWSARPSSRSLPPWWEWLNLRWFTRSREWTAPQRQMMSAAARYYAVRALLVFSMLGTLAWGGLSIRRNLEEKQRAQQAQALVDRLTDAEITQVPAIVEELEPYREWAGPALAALAEDPGTPSRDRLHARLALLPVESSQRNPLLAHLILPDTPPAEVIVIRKALLQHGEEVRDSLWKFHDAGNASPAQKFRAACGLAAADPENPRWPLIAPGLVNTLVTENPIHLRQWLDAFAPVRLALLPALAKVFRDSTRPAQQSVALNVLADYAGDRPLTLAELIVVADPEQYARLLPLLRSHSAQVLDPLSAELRKELPGEEQGEQRNRAARRQAHAAVTLFQLGQPGLVWPLLRAGPGTSRRAYLISALGRLGADAGTVLGQLQTETELRGVRALILSLGEFGAEQFKAEQRTEVTQRLLELYRTHPDSGVHSAADWLLRHGQRGQVPRRMDWRQREALERIDSALAGEPLGERGWFVTRKEGHTLAAVRNPPEFLSGSPVHEHGRTAETEAQVRILIPRSFAIATKEVTVSQFHRFLEDNPEAKRRFNYFKKYSPVPDGPQNSVTWFEAARYCNWLSKQEGIPEKEWCYPPLEVLEQGMELPADYLKRTGYRLPTEAEWEYACRAGSASSWPFGGSEELLGEYGWYAKITNAERAFPVGQLKPNDLGLFDMHGNAMEWCQDRTQGQRTARQGEVIQDVEDALRTVTSFHVRLQRGGSFLLGAYDTRSASRTWREPSNRLFNTGFRIARTIR